MADFKHSLGFNITSEGALVEPTKYQTQGFTAGYKLPAPHFNWIVDKTSKSIDEIHEFLTATTIRAGSNLNEFTDIGMYVYSSADSASIGNAPEKAQSTMLVMPRLLPNDTNNRVQVVITQTNTLYIRNLTGGTWEVWTRHRKQNDIVDIKYGGTSASDVPNARKNFGLPENCVQITDWNETTKTGWYMGNNANNAPTTGWYMGFVLVHASGYLIQEVYQFTVSKDAIAIPKYIRAKTDNQWGEWHNVTIQRNVPKDAKLDYIKTLTSDAQTQLNDIAAKRKLITYSSLADLGITAGSETIANIASKMADNSMLVYQTDSANADIYPHTSLVVTVKRVNANRVEFLATRVNGSQIWFGNYHENSGWTGWKQIYHESALPTPAQIGAVATETILNATADLNNVVTSGMYRLGSTPANAPANSDYGQLLVIHGGQDTIAQLLFPYRSTAMYVRTGFPSSIGGNGQWGEWVKMANANHTHTPAEIGASPSNHSHGFGDISGIVPINKGGTGATEIGQARTNLDFKSGYYMGDGNASSSGANYNKDLGCPYSNLIFIYANSGGNDFYGFLNPNGGFMIDVWRGPLGGQNNEIYYFGPDADQKASYANGVLAIRSNSDYLNANNVKYSYQCL